MPVHPRAIIDHTGALVDVLRRYYDVLGRVRASELEVRAIVENALLAGLSPEMLRGIIEGYSETLGKQVLYPTNVHSALLTDGEQGIMPAVSRQPHMS